MRVFVDGSQQKGWDVFWKEREFLNRCRGRWVNGNFSSMGNGRNMRFDSRGISSERYGQFFELWSWLRMIFFLRKGLMLVISYRETKPSP